MKSKFELIGLVLIALLLSFCSNNNSKKPFIEVNNDFDTALTIAKEKDMKLLVFFDRWGTSNHSMQLMVDKKAKEGKLTGFVVVRLYTDDKEKKVGDTIAIGQKNINIERTFFNTEVNPVFFILNEEGKLVKGPLEYCSEKDFEQFILI